jgi:hypothetical protein
MDIEGSISKLLTPVEKHSALIGAGLGTLWFWKNGNISDDIERLMSGQVHFPDFKEILAVMNDPAFIASAAVGIGGWLLKDATSNATLKKVAGIAQGGGLGYAATFLAFYTLYSMTHSQAPSSGRSGNSPGPLGPRGYS